MQKKVETNWIKIFQKIFTSFISWLIFYLISKGENKASSHSFKAFKNNSILTSSKQHDEAFYENFYSTVTNDLLF